MVFERRVPFHASAPFKGPKHLSHRFGDQGPAPLFSTSLHPAGGGKETLLGHGIMGEVQGGPRNNFRNAGAGYTCGDYFHMEADSQLGVGKRYNVSFKADHAITFEMQVQDTRVVIISTWRLTHSWEPGNVTVFPSTEETGVSYTKLLCEPRRTTCALEHLLKYSILIKCFPFINVLISLSSFSASLHDNSQLRHLSL
ncbi:hypothetical protein TNCV_1139561 [Trichonephila clavipes]|nr:hypothetical protein TNCV_1139561 [Trichonephila clavipes]